MSDEETRARIRRIVEGSAASKTCPLCGFKRFTGGVHPYAGVHKALKSEMIWCTGRKMIRPKTEDPVLTLYQCPKCLVESDQDELTLAVYESQGHCDPCTESIL